MNAGNWGAGAWPIFEIAITVKAQELPEHGGLNVRRQRVGNDFGMQQKVPAYLDGLDCLLKRLGALSAAHQGRGPMSYGVGFTNPPRRVVADPPRSNAATVQCQSDRLLLRESAVCSRDSVRSFGPRRGPAGTGSAPVRPPAAWHNFAHERLRSWGATVGKPSSPAYSFITCQTRRSVTPSPQHLSARQTHRNSLPVCSSAAATQSSMVVLTQHGNGTVRMCPPLPTRSTIAQCSSRCCRCLKSRSANSRLRRPQPSRTARIARSRLPLSVLASGARQSLCAFSAVSQFPSRTPTFLTPFTRRMPAASSGLSKPPSAASYASRRTAASRPLIVPAARPRFSRAIRKRVTTTLLNDNLGSEQYH